MFRLQLVRVLAVAWLLAAVPLTVAHAKEQVPFKGTLDGDYTVVVNPGPPPIGTFEGSGAGKATHLGNFTYEFPHEVNFGELPPLGMGTYTFTAANGDTIVADFVGFSTPVEPGVVLVEEVAVIVDGTGRFAGATGSITITRLVDQVNRTTIGSFTGTISSPGAAKH
jgi:hypothetical protein